MALGIEGIIWYLFLIDSLFAVIFSFCCSKWFKKNYKGFYKHFPVTKGWSLLYLGLVIWIGTALNRLDLIGF